MGTAFITHDFNTAHAVTVIGGGLDGVPVHGRVETRPAGAGIEFGVGTEEFIAATSAAVNARVFTIMIFTGEGALGAFLPADGILFRRQFFFPFLVGFVGVFSEHG